MNQASGIVTAFDESLAFGEVRTQSGRTLFFHCTQIADGSRSIAVGTHVVFHVVAGRMGRWEAAEVAPRLSLTHDHPSPAGSLLTAAGPDSAVFACPACGAQVEGEAGDYEICPMCNWEDDPVQRNDPSFAGGANALSLDEARRTWAANHS